MDIFARLLGSQAGDVVLTYLSTGGLFLGGGIPPKVAAKLQEGGTVEAYLRKGRLSPLVEMTPLHIIKNDRTALLGRAAIAAGCRSGFKTPSDTRWQRLSRGLKCSRTVVYAPLSARGEAFPSGVIRGFETTSMLLVNAYLRRYAHPSSLRRTQVMPHSSGFRMPSGGIRALNQPALIRFDKTFADCENDAAFPWKGGSGSGRSFRKPSSPTVHAQ